MAMLKIRVDFFSVHRIQNLFFCFHKKYNHYNISPHIAAAVSWVSYSDNDGSLLINAIKNKEEKRVKKPFEGNTIPWLKHCKASYNMLYEYILILWEAD